MLGTLKQDHTLTLWDCTFTLPAGTQMQLIQGIGGGWAVRSVKLLIDLTGNTHDPVYRYCFVPKELVDHEPQI